MSAVLRTLANYLIGMVALLAALLALYGFYAIVISDRLVIVKISACIGLALATILCTDNGLGMVLQTTSTPQTFVAKQTTQTSSRLFILFHGYNGYGRELANVLAPYLTQYGTVVAFQPRPGGYDNKKVISAALKAIARFKPSEIVVEGESFGGMTAVDLLRADPGLHLKGLVLNAAPSRAADVKNTYGGLALLVFYVMHGGPISTAVLRRFQANAVKHLPSLEQGTDQNAAKRAQLTSLSVTAPMAFDQLRYICSFKPPQPAEFLRRVDSVRYVHAPGFSDDVIYTTYASGNWRKAFAGADFADIAANWSLGQHTPTPERPGEVARAILSTLD